MSLLIIGLCTIPIFGFIHGIYGIPILIVCVLWHISHYRHWDNFPNKIIYFIKLILYGFQIKLFCIKYKFLRYSLALFFFYLILDRYGSANFYNIFELVNYFVIFLFIHGVSLNFLFS
jgi:hypothetical protein